MVGADESTELWQHPMEPFSVLLMINTVYQGLSLVPDHRQGGQGSEGS